MPKIAYIFKRFRNDTLNIISNANAILESYATQGYDLTLRQLYYQFVAKDLFPDDRTWTFDKAKGKWFRDPNGTKNADPNYDWLGEIISGARMAGLIDWNYIVDRTRNLESLSHWDTPADIMRSALYSYRIDRWERQDYRPEVWIEKDALRGVISRVCQQWDVPHFSCRGYSSQSEMWRASQRILKHIRNGKIPYVIHLGDHDPSGIDMSRDITDRLREFVSYDDSGALFYVKRVALNFNQVEQYNPPPNPAKMTDSRANDYVSRFGDESWELDALEPSVISDLISGTLQRLMNRDIWDEDEDRENREKAEVGLISDNYAKVVKFLKKEI